MTQRTLAGLLAVPLLLALWAVAVFTPLPFVTYEPGLTVNVLGDPDGEEIIQVSGHRTYRDDGELRMTTVFVTQPNTDVNLFDLMEGWISPDAAVLPYSAVYQPEETQESNEIEGEIAMVSSQDAAIAVALTELGIDFEEAIKVFRVEDGAPAAGKLKPGDVVVAIDGKPVTTTKQVRDAVEATPAGAEIEFRVLRKGFDRTVVVTPETQDGKPRVGIETLPSYRFPFDVEVGIDESIGGPSAGLLFSLGIYDTLTPGSLTDGAIVAGTGTLDPDGDVGPIGGIQQKIAAARDTGAELFLVPPENCSEALGAENGDTQLVRADTMHDAVTAIEAWVDDPDADLPQCSEEAA